MTKRKLRMKYRRYTAAGAIYDIIQSSQHTVFHEQLTAQQLDRLKKVTY